MKMMMLVILEPKVLIQCQHVLHSYTATRCKLADVKLKRVRDGLGNHLKQIIKNCLSL